MPWNMRQSVHEPIKTSCKNIHQCEGTGYTHTHTHTHFYSFQGNFYCEQIY